MENNKHVLSILVDNEPGVLSRISGLFSGRGYNIDSLCVAETTEPGVSRITIVTKADDTVVEQIKKQLNKLINVIKVFEFAGNSYVERQMALIKVNAKPEHRAEVLRITDIFRCKVVDVSLKHYTIEVTGTEDKLNALLNMLKPIGIKEIVKTGTVALLREPK
ncbi:MAG: acetolactate synthase small subunit [Proteobacteria bacterium]|nr:acetolactate synthase small subunit [Desulfobacteraceae bacterium]MBU4000813.1 acetolactate synthase small subunit [Pseudomonadota bacterium]MBU4053455.1 acetolactate synthase small subunit [Pseudomonadota bacterium]MBU4315908.1 acetolactate synthase small subunit [Pseudomonadota bacterium]MBU4471398.1 acetolactate synthase small subunit [Pseudomonadota bacterium]